MLNMFICLHSGREEIDNPQSRAVMEKGQGGGVGTRREYIQSTKEGNSLSLGKRLSMDLAAEKFIDRSKLRNSSEITSKALYEHLSGEKQDSFRSLKKLTTYKSVLKHSSEGNKSCTMTD